MVSKVVLGGNRWIKKSPHLFSKGGLKGCPKSPLRGCVAIRQLDRTFVFPVPHQVRDKLQPETSIFKRFWAPACAGVTAEEHG